jgi:hypothetical protein
MSGFHSLPAFYNGTEFKSRLEARTAYYFDLLGIRWQYEPEAFALNSGNYLPDFLCNNTFFVEVKPDYSAFTAYERRLRELCQATKKEVFYFPGLPQEPSYIKDTDYWSNSSVSWRFEGDHEREDLLDEIGVDHRNPDDEPFLSSPYACNTRRSIDSFFVWYAFCKKEWGCPYYGDYCDGFDEDITFVKRAKGLKFDRAGRAVL